MKNLIIGAVFTGAMAMFAVDVMPKLSGGPLEVRTRLSTTGDVLAVGVSNKTKSPWLLREVSCKPIGAGDDTTVLRTIHVDQTIQPGQSIELSTPTVPTIGQFKCSQVALEQPIQKL